MANRSRAGHGLHEPVAEFRGPQLAQDALPFGLGFGLDASDLALGLLSAQAIRALKLRLPQVGQWRSTVQAHEVV